MAKDPAIEDLVSYWHCAETKTFERLDEQLAVYYVCVVFHCFTQCINSSICALSSFKFLKPSQQNFNFGSALSVHQNFK